MAVAKAGSIDSFLRKPDPAVIAILFYGSDTAGIDNLARRTVAKFAGSADDPFAVVPLEESALSADPGRLADEAGALSMFGGQKVIWIRDCDSVLAKAIAPLLDSSDPCNIIVAQAGSLGKASPLRALFEKSARALIVPVYEPSSEDIENEVRRRLSGSESRIDEEALERLVSLVGRDRGLAAQEVDKLLLYCHGQPGISLADVMACSSGAGDDKLDTLVDCVFNGDVEGADRAFGELSGSGNDAGRMASVLHAHAVRLQEFKAAVEKGQTAEAAVRGARPVIFFSRVPLILSQLRIWTLSALLQAGNTFADAVRRSRTDAELAPALVSRSVLSVARNARAVRNPGRTGR